MKFTEEQQSRLAGLGASPQQLSEDFPSLDVRNKSYQKLESELTARQRVELEAYCAGPRRPYILELEEKLSAVLRGMGFLQVHSPIILTRKRLEKMGVFEGNIMEKQVFWLDRGHCLRPMLAPHLYEYMRETGRLLPRPIRLFEIGPCFRRESQGQRHASEFTMLNIVEMGLPEDVDRELRLRELGSRILETAEISGWRMEKEVSVVYGDTIDFVDSAGMELASSAIGPLAMDAPWGITENWVGIGFGLERLVMSSKGDPNIAKAGRGLNYLGPVRMRL